jgi:hypothetical protein
MISRSQRDNFFARQKPRFAMSASTSFVVTTALPLDSGERSVDASMYILCELHKRITQVGMQGLHSDRARNLRA